MKSTKSLAGLMNGVGLFKQTVRIGGKETPKVYRLSSDVLEDLQARYAPKDDDIPDETDSGERVSDEK